MKKTTLLTITLAAATLTACNNDNPTPSTGADEPNFTASIATAARAYDNTWESGDAIGISGQSGDKTYSNLKYTTDGTGAFAAAGDHIYFQNNAEVIFTAYYPWSDAAATADTRLQASQKTFDYLWAQATGSKASPDVAFNLAHKMSKVVITARCGSDVTYDEVKKAVLALGEFNTSAAFDRATGIVTSMDAATLTFANNATAEQNAPAIADDAAKTVAYTLIVAPQSFGSALTFTATQPGAQTYTAAIDFTAANRNAGIADPRNEWLAGYQYDIAVTIHKTGVSIQGCTITAWTEADGGNFDAK